MRKILLVPMLSLALFACDRQDQPKKGQYSLTQFEDFQQHNMRDRSLMSSRSDSQSDNAEDMEITQEIRQAIMADTSLSPGAKSIKIITNDGVVIIRGQVLNNAERDAILNKVKAVQGILKVDDQIEVTH